MNFAGFRMSCTAELYFSQSQDRVEGGELDPESPYLQSPSYQLPLLWLALFDPKNLGAEAEDSYLVTEKVAGLERLNRRIPKLLAAASGLEPEWASAFVQLLTDANFTYIHMDTGEFESAAGSAESWIENVRSMLSSFDSDEDLRDLVESLVPEEAINEYWSYCGSSEDESAPWEL